MVVALLGAGLAQGAPPDAPRWVIDPAADNFNTNGGVGFAYVEAFRHPAYMEQIDTGLFVACDPAAQDGFELYLWTQEGRMPALNTATQTLSVLTRRDQDAVRSQPWRVVDFGDGYQEVFADATTRAALFDDLRRGGVLAVRVESDPSLGAAQPTFEFLVDGFAEVEAVLSVCAGQRASQQPARDPFAAPADPFAAPPATDPFAAPPVSDPFAAPPAANPFAAPPAADPFAAPPVANPFGQAPAVPAAPSGAEDGGQFLDPITGLISFQTALTEYRSLPVQSVDQVVNDSSFAALVGPTNAQGRFNAIGFVCQAGAGQNGLYIELMSTWLQADEILFAVFFDAGREIGGIEVETELSNSGTPTGYVVWDEDEVGFATAVEVFDRLDVLLFVGDAAEPSDHWRLDTASLRPALAGLSCSPR